MAGFGNSQIINGQSYIMYTPPWYAAQEAEKQRAAASNGQAAGTTAGSALNALQNIVPGVSSSAPTGAAPTVAGAPASSIPPVSYPGSTSMPSVQGTGGVPVMSPSAGVPSGGGAAAAPGPVALNDVNRSGAQAAEFNRAKDLVGQTSAGALTGLRSALASRGQLGGAGEFSGGESILRTGQQQLGDTVRQQAIDATQREADAEALRYTGEISQRGQDITTRGQDLGYSTAAQQLAAQIANNQYQGGIEQRGQDIQMRGQDIAGQTSAGQLQLAQQQQQQQLILNALKSLSY